jgi:GxxExxY protein
VVWVNGGERRELSDAVLGAAIEVHRTLGPGLLESIYHECMAHELELRSVPYESHVSLPLEYKGLTFEKTYEADIVVAKTMVLELKSVQTLLAVHEAQLLTYMNLLEADVGYLLNFNVRNLVRDGLKRFVL